MNEENYPCEKLGADYTDICLLHAVRNAADIIRRRRMLNAVLKLKQRGILRAVGLSAHGIEALEATSSSGEIDAFIIGMPGEQELHQNYNICNILAV